MIVNPDLGTILGVWAHPDDECYLSGGLMAASVQAGRRVACVTATRGEMADPERWPPADLARVREAELAGCLRVLGVAEHRWLDYPDAGCHEVDDDEAAARIAQIIFEVQPDTVLTFGPDGMTGHLDHIAVSRWTERAVSLADTGARLLFATHTPDWVAEWERVGKELDIMMGADALPETPEAELAVNLRVEGELLELKERAMLAQASQVSIIVDAIGPELYRALLSEEAFRPAP